MPRVNSPPAFLVSRIPAIWSVVAFLLFVAGAAAFLAAIWMGESLRAWQTYLVNFVFWTGMAFGAVIFSAVLNVTGARWGRPVKRLAEAFAAYLPPAFILFWLLYFGKEELFPWIRQPVPEKAAWLNAGFMFARNGAGLLLLTALSGALTYYSVKGDRLAGQTPVEKPSPTGTPGAFPATWSMQRRLSPALIIAFGFVLSLLAFDLIMSLDPHWCSTLLGGYYFIGSFYSGVAALYLLSLALTKAPALREYIRPRQLHDLGKLVMAFCLFTGYLFYTQFLVIWYGNLPEETRYVILRVKLTPWEPLAWAILFMIFLIPFFVLLSKKVKVKRVPMILLSVLILTGMWLERFILVVPSVWKQGTIPIGLLEALITAGFFGLVGLSLTLFLRMVPIMPVSDPLFRQLVAEKEERLEP
jgi:hypothetical protein